MMYLLPPNRHVQQTPEKKSMKSLSIDQETQVVRGELPSSDSSGGATPEEGPISEDTLRYITGAQARICLFIHLE